MTKDTNLSEPAIIFNKVRPMLMGLTYRILGSVHDAEDVVQDVCETWLGMDTSKISQPERWLSVACSRRAIDRLRMLKRARPSYIGEWLPEPIQTDPAPDAEQQILLSETLTTAFLLILEQLSPKERAAYLLREIFSSNYSDIAETLQIGESACRQLVSRAKKRLKTSDNNFAPIPSNQQQLLDAFHHAIRQGDVGQLKSMLAQDVVLYADSGGKAQAISKPIHGSKAVTKFFDKVLLPIWNEHGADLQPFELNGQTGLVQHIGDTVIATITFAYDRERKTAAIYIVRNPDKLEKIQSAFAANQS